MTFSMKTYPTKTLNEGDRATLHKLLDMMIDQGETAMTYEYFTKGEEEYTFVRKTARMMLQISGIEQRIDGRIRQNIL